MSTRFDYAHLVEGVMTPNLFLLTAKLVNPRSWFSGSSQRCSSDRDAQAEHLDEPVTGTYRYTPEYGWFLTKRDKSINGEPASPEPEVWCAPLYRWMSKAEMLERTRRVGATSDQGETRSMKVFRLDDGFTWVNCWHDDGTFNPRLWQRWCFDENSGKLRPMLIRDDPTRKRRDCGSWYPTLQSRSQLPKTARRLLPCLLFRPFSNTRQITWRYSPIMVNLIALLNELSQYWRAQLRQAVATPKMLYHLFIIQ